ncbi:hypothetical protein TI39_contig4209g00003 [Zymoseptoria brevis]|uniref:Carboxypeptidase M14B n=1 Tax=Zymoseptoria brevis TaxID=1047168 RepID=A0A0F4GA21_9PEZI|nr:hypothetical protein TI39_contig4209g00003 [Zymoseptoria brevis]
MALRIAFATFLAAAGAARYGDNRNATRLDPPQVEASFPPPHVTLLSPAFLQKDSVPAGFSNGTEAEYTSEEGRMFPYVYLSTQSGNATSASYSQKVRIWIQGGVHGNEPAADQAVLALLGKMDANETWTASVLEKVDIMILPRYNPDGFYYFQRVLASGFDPNRDHIKLARQQTRDIKQKFSAFAPHVAVDMHEFKASARYGGLYNPGVDAMIAAAKNLNIDNIESGIQTFINSNDPIVVMDTTNKSQRNFTMVEYKSGKLVQVETDFYSTTPATANRTATHPEAYIIPRAWADLVTRLKISGVEVETLFDMYSGEVEAYNITASVLGRSYF